MPTSHRSEYLRVSKRARQLLARAEGFDVDFKVKLSAVASEDLVAFANSDFGGAMLVGVDEVETAGVQRGKIVGCRVGDSERLTIASKAANCVPPVAVQVVVENRAKEPFLRIEIPSSNFRPHSTGKGIYKIREDGSNRGLHRNELLAMFLDVESETFLARFHKATQGLRRDLHRVREEVRANETAVTDSFSMIRFEVSNLVDDVRKRIDSIGQYLAEANEQIAQGLADINSVAQDARSSAEDAGNSAQELAKTIDALSEDLGHLSHVARKSDEGIVAIARNVGVDLEVIRLEEQIRFMASMLFLRDDNDPADYFRQMQQRPGPVQDGRVSQEEFTAWFNESLSEARRGGSEIPDERSRRRSRRSTKNN